MITTSHIYLVISQVLTRLQLPWEVDGRRVSTNLVDVVGNKFTYDRPRFSEGDHTVSVTVTDENGKTAQDSSKFTVVYPEASVSIDSPVTGHTYDHTYRHISGEFTGVGGVSVNLLVDGTRVYPDVVGNKFTYYDHPRFSEGEHTVFVSVRDANGKTDQAETKFLVVYPDASVSIDSPAAGHTYDHTFSHISGEFTGVGDVDVKITVDGVAIVPIDEELKRDGDTLTEFSYDLSPQLSGLSDRLPEGDYTVTVSVKDANGKTDQASTTFSVVYPEASVSIDSPVAAGTYDHTFSHITGEAMGVGEVTVDITVEGTAEDGTAIAPIVKNGILVPEGSNEFTHNLSDKLLEGDYTVSVSVTDANGETATALTTFSVVYPEASVSIDSPVAAGTYDHTFSHITGEAMGVGEVTVDITVEGTAEDGTAIAPIVKNGILVPEGSNEFTHNLSDKLLEGDYTVSVSVTDANGETATALTTFSVVYPEASVSIDSPVAAGTYDHTFSHITGEAMGVGEVTVDITVEGTAEDGTAIAPIVKNGILVPEGSNEFTHNLSDKLLEGDYTVSVSVTDANGETATASTTFSVVYPEASVTIDSPAAGHTYDHNFSHISGHYTGIGDVEVVLKVDGKAVPTKKVGDNEFTAESPELAHGDHTVSVEVTDANGETAQTATTFKVDVPGPTVTILSPASGQTYDHGAPVIRAEFEGSTDVDVTTFTINGEDAEGEVKDNQLAYTPDPVLGDGEHTVVVVVTDANKKTAEASVVFSVMRDKTAPIISAYAPIGVVRLNKVDVAEENMGVTITADISDPESDLLSVKYLIDGNAPTQSYPVDHAANKFEITRSFTPGTHSITLIVESEGGIKEFSWKFTLEVDEAPPTISNITPSGTVMAGLPTISASATDDTGVEEMSITLMDSKGKEVKGKASDDSEDRANEGITRLDFNPDAPLEEGTYTINVRATDGYGNSSTAKGGFTVTFDTAAPIITMASPQNGSRLTYKHDEERKPNISIAYADAGTGINVDSIRFVLNDQLINLTSKQKSASQVNYTPPADLEPGKYVVKLEVSDNAHQQGNVSEKTKGAREANTSVYEFSFFVERGDTPIMWAAPFNYPNPFSKNTRISLVLARRANVSITIFDSTLRPVRVLVDNEVMDAGNYTKNPAGAGTNAFGWDGKSSSGEDLARGIYFCQIEVNDGIEPEFAILKLALTR